jgi:hypothetical protein
MLQNLCHHGSLRQLLTALPMALGMSGHIVVVVNYQFCTKAKGDVFMVNKIGTFSLAASYFLRWGGLHHRFLRERWND